MSEHRAIPNRLALRRKEAAEALGAILDAKAEFVGARLRS